MQIKVYGFEWEMPPAATPQDLLEYFSSIKGAKIKNTVLGITTIEKWSVGVLMSIKDAKSFTQIQERQGSFTVRASQLAEGRSIVDLNFFVIWPGTGRGLYQHYYMSPSLRLFSQYCARQYHDAKPFLIENRKQKQMEQANGNNLSGAVLAGIRRDFSGLVSCQPLLKPQKFAEYVRTLKRVDFLRLEPRTYKAGNKLFQPVIARAKRQTINLRYDRYADLGTLNEEIAALAENGQLVSATVEGVDENDRAQTYHLLHDVEVFAEFDYDELFSVVSLDSNALESSIEQSEIATRLLRIANSRHVKPLLVTPKG